MPFRVPINRSRWSPSSQRSSASHYDDRAEFYEGIACRCRACGASFVFAPEQQCQAYEVDQRFVHWLPNLCNSCWATLAALQNRDREFQFKWNSDKASLAQDLAFLKEWLSVLQALRAHGNANPSMEQMLATRIYGQSVPGGAA